MVMQALYFPVPITGVAVHKRNLVTAMGDHTGSTLRRYKYGPNDTWMDLPTRTSRHCYGAMRR